MKFSRVEMLETMKNRDSRYDGVFFVGVRTMKIYCLPSCKAKLPLHKNVVFFLREEEALASNYRHVDAASQIYSQSRGRFGSIDACSSCTKILTRRCRILSWPNWLE